MKNKQPIPDPQPTPLETKEENVLMELKEEGVQIPINVTEVLESLPEEKRKVIVGALCAVEESSTFRGPLPPPDILKGYEVILPGSFERILKMAEKQQEHRMSIEKTIVDRRTRQSGRGQIFGAILALLFGAGAVFLGYFGHDILAGVISTTTIIGLATIFVLSKKPDKTRKENMEEDDNSDE